MYRGRKDGKSKGFGLNDGRWNWITHKINALLQAFHLYFVTIYLHHHHWSTFSLRERERKRESKKTKYLSLHFIMRSPLQDKSISTLKNFKTGQLISLVEMTINSSLSASSHRKLIALACSQNPIHSLWNVRDFLQALRNWGMSDQISNPQNYYIMGHTHMHANSTWEMPN